MAEPIALSRSTITVRVFCQVKLRPTERVQQGGVPVLHWTTREPLTADLRGAGRGISTNPTMRATALDMSTKSWRRRCECEVSIAVVIQATATVPTNDRASAKPRLTSTLVWKLGTSMWKTAVMTSYQAQPTQIPNA